MHFAKNFVPYFHVIIGWPEGSPGNVFGVLGHLDHRDELFWWARGGTPQPLMIPLNQFGDNCFNRWFPDTGV